jgi:hypothetical protein
MHGYFSNLDGRIRSAFIGRGWSNIEIGDLERIPVIHVVSGIDGEGNKRQVRGGTVGELITAADKQDIALGRIPVLA